MRASVWWERFRPVVVAHLVLAVTYAMMCFRPCWSQFPWRFHIDLLFCALVFDVWAWGVRKAGHFIAGGGVYRSPRNTPGGQERTDARRSEGSWLLAVVMIHVFLLFLAYNAIPNGIAAAPPRTPEAVQSYLGMRFVSYYQMVRVFVPTAKQFWLLTMMLWCISMVPAFLLLIRHHPKGAKRCRE